LQFIFEQVSICDEFPLGVKTTYRAYAADNVMEIIEDPLVDVKLRPVNVLVYTYPTPESNENAVGGMYILQSIPSSQLIPYPLPKPSKSDTNLRQPITKAASAVEKVYSVVSQDVIKEWKEFEDLFPLENETVTEYIIR
jgi:hypothetical protein